MTLDSISETEDVYYRLDEAQPVRQGDILGWYDQRLETLTRLGVVLTADCDIAQQKITEHYAVLPIRSLDFYLRNYWLDLRSEKLLQAIAATTAELVRQQRKADGQPAVAPDISAVLNWFMQSKVEGLFERVRFSDSRAKEIATFHRLAQDLVGLRKSLDGRESFSGYSKIYGEFRKLAQAPAADRIRGELKGFLSDLPQDVFLLNSLPVEVGKSFVALLRYVDVAGIDQVATGFRSAKDQGRRIIRICRLTDRFRFALSQKFANLYSRIGLPERYEAEQRKVIELVCSECIV